MHLTTQDFDNHYKYESKKTRVMDLIHLDIFENFIVEKGHQWKLKKQYDFVRNCTIPNRFLDEADSIDPSSHSPRYWSQCSCCSERHRFLKEVTFIIIIVCSWRELHTT